MPELVVDATGNDLTYRIIGAAMAVHNFLGPGYKEEVYERALAVELRDRGIGVERQFRVEVFHNDAPVGLFYLDLFVERTVVVEVKAFAHRLTDDERAQAINYLKATQAPVALVFNFGRRRLDRIRVFPGSPGPVQRIGRDDVTKSRRRDAPPPDYIPASKRTAIRDSHIRAQFVDGGIRDSRIRDEFADGQRRRNTMTEEKQNAKYHVVHAEYSAIGDYARVNNYFPPDRVAADPGQAELRRLFEEVNRRLDEMPSADRELVAPAVEQAAQAAAEIQSGDESEEKQRFLETRLKHIVRMAPDIGQVIVATLVNPAAGVALVIQKIAQRVQDELGGEE